jgi:hypothetical protein
MCVNIYRLTITLLPKYKYKLMVQVATQVDVCEQA